MKTHILCLGDSNTHGYCADPTDCADGGGRFNEEERWTCLLQKALGPEVLVTEEGLSGRTTVFPDPLEEGLDAISLIAPLLRSHKDINLLIIMLGTNDARDIFNASALCISLGMERLVRKAISVDCWGGRKPNILIIAPPPIGLTEYDDFMGRDCGQKSRQLPQFYAQVAERLGCHFLDAKDCQFNSIDHMHLTRLGHAQLADELAQLVPTLL